MQISRKFRLASHFKTLLTITTIKENIIFEVIQFDVPQAKLKLH